MFLVSGGFGISCSSIIISGWGVALILIATSSESGGSVCFRFAFGCFTDWMKSVGVGCSSVEWYGGWVLGGVVGDMYGNMLDCWLVAGC